MDLRSGVVRGICENGRDTFSLYSLPFGWREEEWVVIQGLPIVMEDEGEEDLGK